MILDHIDNIKIVDGITPVPNYHSIPHLLEGIFLTYNHMIDLNHLYWEISYPEMSPEELEVQKKASFSLNAVPNKADSIGVNLFHWYSINLINYVKCCGLIKFINKNGILPEKIANNKNLISELKKTQTRYIESIPEFEPVIHFRNKAGAHLAITDPRNDDNSATLIESFSIIPTYINGKLTLGALTRGKSESTSSFSEYSWNIVDNFISLIPRYFKQYINDNSEKEENSS